MDPNYTGVVEVIVSVVSGPKLVHVALPFRNRLVRNLFRRIFRIDLLEALGLLVHHLRHVLDAAAAPLPLVADAALVECFFFKHSTCYDLNFEHDSS